VLLEIGEPDLDERPHPILQPRLDRDGERLLPALAGLVRAGALLQAVVPRDEEPLDPLTGIVFPLHKCTVTRQI
jgi:hypothetical protein